MILPGSIVQFYRLIPAERFQLHSPEGLQVPSSQRQGGMYVARQVDY